VQLPTTLKTATLNMPLQFFSPTEVEVLILLTERMVGTDFPDVELSPTVTTIDAFVAGLPSNLRVQLRRALRLFQWCPILFTGKLRPFTRLSPHDADTYIRSWAESRFGLRRRLFRGLRDLTFLGYYGESATDIYQTSTDKPERR
jgi:hypothetical protein